MGIASYKGTAVCNAIPSADNTILKWNSVTLKFETFQKFTIKSGIGDNLIAVFASFVCVCVCACFFFANFRNPLEILQKKLYKTYKTQTTKNKKNAFFFMFVCFIIKGIDITNINGEWFLGVSRYDDYGFAVFKWNNATNNFSGMPNSPDHAYTMQNTQRPYRINFIC